MKEFYTIFYPVTGDIRAKKELKKLEIPKGHFVIFERRWGQTYWISALGGISTYKQFYLSFRFGENWENLACEGTQAVLAMTLYRLFWQH